MHIGRAAKRAGVTIDAIRFYERAGILGKAPRTGGGFRTYADDDVKALRFVQRTQRLGFSLAEIRELLALSRNQIRPCAAVRDRLHHKLEDVRARMRALAQLEREIRAASRRCNAELRKSTGHCPLLEATDAKTDSPRSARRK